jgi:flagellar hook-length control protein FliK
MAAVENIFANSSAPLKDVARGPSKVPFAPILASQIEARISDLAAPHATQPANNDRFEVKRNNHGDDRIHREERETRTDDTSRPERPRAEATSREDTRVDDLDIGASAREAGSPRHAGSDIRPENADPSGKTDTVATRSTTSEESPDTPETASSTSEVTSSATAVATTMDPAAERAPINLADGSPPAPAIAAMDRAGTVVGAARASANTAAPSGAAASLPAGGSGAPSGGLVAPIAGDPASPAKADGKINIAGMTPSNDEKPSRLGLDVPQIVREVQSIVARPANAAGGNLVQAHQQGDAPVQQALNAPAQPGNTAPLSQNAGQGAPLHVGADGSGNAGQNTNQNAGQSGNNPNGQSPNGQSANGQAANRQSGIAGAPPNGPLAEGMAAQQSAQSFQSNLARSTGPVGAGGPGPVSADGSTMARGDGAISGTGSSQGTLSSDPASRAAQASTPHLARNGAATDQVSVSLKKAVENGDSKLRIQLRPHDLGKVEVKLDIAGDGRAKAMILAERPETLELLQRDSRVLERALQDAGLKTDHNSLSFDLQGRDGEERTRQAQRGDEDGKGSPAEPGGGDAIENSEHPIPATAIGLAPDGSVNFLA